MMGYNRCSWEDFTSRKNSPGPPSRNTFTHRTDCALWGLSVKGFGSSSFILHSSFSENYNDAVEPVPEFSAHPAIEQIIYNMLYNGISEEFNTIQKGKSL